MAEVVQSLLLPFKPGLEELRFLEGGLRIANDLGRAQTERFVDGWSVLVSWSDVQGIDAYGTEDDFDDA